MSHNNRAGERGTRWETTVVTYLQDNGLPGAERRRLRGKRDAGDLTGVPGWVIGCKDEQRIDLAGYMDELAGQAVNSGREEWAAEVVKRRRRPVGDAYVVMPLWQFTMLLKEGL